MNNEEFSMIRYSRNLAKYNAKGFFLGDSHFFLGLYCRSLYSDCLLAFFRDSLDKGSFCYNIYIFDLYLNQCFYILGKRRQR